MGNLEKLHQQEFQEGFIQNEFGRMIETSTAKAILVNHQYDAGEMTTRDENRLTEFKKELVGSLDKSFDSINISKKLRSSLIPSLVSFVFKEEKGLWLGSGGFIRPNVILTAAHMIRDTETGGVSPIYNITDGKGNEYTVKAIYFNKIHTDDIAFIVTEEISRGYINLYNRNISPGKDIITLGMSNLKPRFTQGEKGNTLFQSIMSLRPGGIDKDNDGEDDTEEYLLTNNPTLYGDSGGLAISDTGKIVGIVSQGVIIGGSNIGGTYLEPQSKIVDQYGDFIQAMTKLGVEIK